MKITPRIFSSLIAGLLAVASVAHATDVVPQDQPALPQLAAALAASAPSTDTLALLAQGGLALLGASAVHNYGHPSYPYSDGDVGIQGTALALSMPAVSLANGHRTGCGIGLGSYFGAHATGLGCAHAWTLPGGQAVTARFGAARATNQYTGAQASVSISW